MSAPASLAAWLDSYRRGLRGGLSAAREDGFRLVSANTADTELDPRDFPRSARRHLARHLRDLGLAIPLLAAEFPGAGLADPRRADERFERFRDTLEMCADLGVPLAAVNIGGLSDPKGCPLAEQLLAAAADLADRFGIRTAVRSEPAALDELAERLRRLGCPMLGVSLDSAELGGRMGELLERALPAAQVVYLRDARRVGERIEEVPYGRGEVDFPALLGGLEAGGYGGPLVIRREDENLTVDALRQGREYVASLLAGRRTR
jgi:sugar phosphate isomerase/epimerase